MPSSKKEDEMSGNIRTLVTLLAGVFFFPATSKAQLLKLAHPPGMIFEGSWQSCRLPDGQYEERIYDHVVNGIGIFELHLGPKREFAMFKGVQDEHRDHDWLGNLLKPYDVPLDNNRAKHTWDVPTLGLRFSVVLAGGSRTDCESWVITLGPIPISSSR